MNDTLLAIIIIYWVLGTIICCVTGLNYRIGGGKAAAMSIVFSPAVALIITYLSRSWEDVQREEKILTALEASNKKQIL